MTRPCDIELLVQLLHSLARKDGLRPTVGANIGARRDQIQRVLNVLNSQ
jgi:hypothetical protein